ncbi:MAG: ATP-binding protein [Pseudomonadales bacterium]|nr:ATP-binding protein [Pseudomonadales bacterium]
MTESNRIDLIDSKEYGYCCLVKTCKRVLERLEDVENRVRTRITPRERIETPLWNPVALREAVINAIIHNNYSTELVPKFKIFNDRLEITSAGAIHPGKEQEDFFSGYSMPRNKTLMRVFKDLGMVEYLGSCMPRILKAYPREAFTFASQFIRLSMPMSEVAPVTGQVAGQVAGQVTSLIGVLQGAMSRKELMAALDLTGRDNFEKLYLRPALAEGYIDRKATD